jgi:hypothetical protein
MYPPIQVLRETLTRKDLPPVCEYDLEAEAPAQPAQGSSVGEGAPSVSELPAGIELGKVLCEANEA